MNGYAVLEDIITFLVTFPPYILFGFLLLLLNQDLGGIIPVAPFSGAFLRFRINYEPQTGPVPDSRNSFPRNAEGNTGTHVNTTERERVEHVRGFFHMLKKTWQIEVCLFRPVRPALILTSD